MNGLKVKSSYNGVIVGMKQILLIVTIIFIIVIAGIRQNKWEYIAGTENVAIYIQHSTEKIYYCNDDKGNIYKNLYAEYKFVNLINNSYIVRGISFDNTRHYAYKFIKEYDKLGNLYYSKEWQDNECANWPLYYDSTLWNLYDKLLPKLKYEQPKPVKNNSLTSDNSNIKSAEQKNNKPISKKNKVKQMDIEYKPPFERIH